MSGFKVIQIINANTIRVEPNWVIESPDGTELSDDKIKITGLDVNDNNVQVINRLNSFLLNQYVEPYNPKIISGHTAQIECKIYLSKTDILYYFPEFTSNYAMAH